jgi:glycosyltransferase involved in cell wall biosynthesis
MDIAFVTTRLIDKDAQGNFSAATLSALKQRCKGRVTLYTFAYERPPVEGVEVRYLGKAHVHSTRSNIDAFLRTRQIAKELAGYDLILLAGPDMGVLPAIHMAKRQNPRLRLTWIYHSMTPPEYLPSMKDRILTRLRLAAFHMSMRRSDLVQTFSGFVKKELTDSGIDAEKIMSAPFLIDTGRFSSGDREKVRAQYGCGDRFVLLYVGRLAPAKRVDRLLWVMGKLEDAPVMLIVIGGGPEEGRLKVLASGMGLDDTVRFAGRVPDNKLPDYYAACDAWVTASDHEGFCVPIVEAMAAGKPVIVPDLAAMPETAGSAGLAYAPGDATALASAIKTLASDRESYRRMAAKAVGMASRFDIDTAMDGYIDLLCGAGKAP